jgi:translation initiation factor IF-2
LAVRIFTLAKELQMSSKKLIGFLRTQGHAVASHMSNIDDAVAQIIRDRHKPNVKPPDKERALKDRPGDRPGGKPTGVPGKAKASTQNGSAGSSTTKRREPARAATSGAAATQKPRFGVDAVRGAKPPTTAKSSVAERERKAREKEREAPTRKRYFPTREDLYESGPRFGGNRRRMPLRGRGRRDGGADGTSAPERPAKVEVTLPITVKDLSSAMGIKGVALIKILMQQGHPVHINQFLSEELVTIISVECGIDVVSKKEADVEDAVSEIEALESKAEDLRPRAPVVTFLGHVDHGKTSLLDKIRETSVTEKEAGGITQHIGAYRVDKGPVQVVFIDTPGHQAFTEMRARGANVTDVAVLVVAADDGVKPQTEEAYAHARAAGVPIVVALNKMDKGNADPMRAKQDLATLGLQPVEWGGDTEFVEVSAMTSHGIDTLLETLSLTSEILELKADPTRNAVGIVLEAEASRSRGVLATILVRDGTLRQGDYVVSGVAHGRIKGMWMNGDLPVTEAGPSTPVKVTGLNHVPEAGEKVYAFDDPQAAKAVAEARLGKRQVQDRGDRLQVTRENIFDTIQLGAVEEVRLVIKSDVRGSLEALRSEVIGLATDEVKVNLLHSGVGTINQSDVQLAMASQPQAIVIGFNVATDDRARSLAEEKDVSVRTYDVIYKVVEDVRKALKRRLAPVKHEELHGHVEIRHIFKASKVGNIAGCMVTDGLIGRSDQVRLLRDGRIVHTGLLTSLKRFKDDAREVRQGFECGIKIADYNDIQPGDVLEAFAIVERERDL